MMKTTAIALTAIFTASLVVYFNEAAIEASSSDQGTLHVLQADQMVTKLALAIGEDQAERSVIDVGLVESGQQVKRVIVLVNDGVSPVYINSITPACGCTVASLPSNVLDPGASITVPVVFTPPDSTSGQFKRAIAIKFHDDRGATDTATFWIQGNVIRSPRASAFPAILNFGDVVAGETSRRQIYVNLRLGDPELPSTSIGIYGLDVTVADLPLADSDSEHFLQEFTISLSIPTWSSPGPFSSKLILRDRNHRIPDFPIIVRGIIADQRKEGTHAVIAH